MTPTSSPRMTDDLDGRPNPQHQCCLSGSLRGCWFVADTVAPSVELVFQTNRWLSWQRLDRAQSPAQRRSESSKCDLTASRKSKCQYLRGTDRGYEKPQFLTINCRAS